MDLPTACSALVISCDLICLAWMKRQTNQKIDDVGHVAKDPRGLNQLQVFNPPKNRTLEASIFEAGHPGI